MEAPASGEGDQGSIKAAAGRLLQRLMAVGDNRLQLLMVEVEAERERFLRAICLTIGLAVFGLLAGICFTFLMVLAFWNSSPVLALLVLVLVYVGTGAWFFTRLVRLQKNWQTLPETIDQLRKDRECLEKHLG